MAKLERQQPAPTRSPSEIEFVLRHAKRKSGPEVLRDLARAADEPSPARGQASANRRPSERG